jgi:AcrR family transcriptional regulator
MTTARRNPDAPDTPSPSESPYAALPPKKRLLAAASDLFYREGVHSVGIDRVIDEAGVARGTLYNSYGNKDGLVAAYLRARHESTTNRIMESLERHRTPRARLLGVFEAQGELFDDEFNGCAFVNATAERHDPSADEAAAEFRRWIRTMFTDLAAEAGARDPAELGRRLHLLYDGAGISARMDRDGGAAGAARAAAAALLDAAG